MQAIDTQLGELIREGIEDDELDALAGASHIRARGRP
jgi:hypothetical protein